MMIQRYYNEVIEQIMSSIGNTAHNIALIHYSNDYSIWDFENVNCYSGQPDVFFYCYEYSYNEIAEGYEPYLTIIKQMFTKYYRGTFEDFLDECNVYQLHRPVFKSYFMTGCCKREEDFLADEAEYEQKRMSDSIVSMLLKLSEIHPVFIVLNRFQLAAKSTMKLTERLLCEETKNIGLLIGARDIQTIPEFKRRAWNAVYENIYEKNRVYEIAFDKHKKEPDTQEHTVYDSEECYRRLNNLVQLFDFDQADYYLNQIERKIKFDNFLISDQKHYHFLLFQIMVSILRKDIAKALETCEDLEKIQAVEKEGAFCYNFCLATSNMYLGKLEEALDFAGRAKECAKKLENEFYVFRTELLEAQIRMSGWYNIFFCAKDMEISDDLIEKLNQYGYKNHLAHIYVFAFDNQPETVAKAYDSEESLMNFSKGVALAKEIGNEHLLNMAYRKNIMIASSNGAYGVALLYSVRTYEVMKDVDSVEGGRIFSGIAYNLCAMGENEIAGKYYNKAIKILCKLKKPEDIAEVHYNMSLNCIMLGQYAKAQEYLTQCMRTIEKLQMNSLRVCTLSKLYGLCALVYILQGNRFNCERYLYSCKQFIKYIALKEKKENQLATAHDYAKADDEMFLYTFSQALLAMFDGNNHRALRLFEKADVYLRKAEGSQFFSYALFRRSRMECLREAGLDALCEKEEADLKQYEETHRAKYRDYANKIKAMLPFAEGRECEENSAAEIDELIKQESIKRAYKSKKEQLDFISTWQKLLDGNGIRAEKMMKMVMKTFLNHFDVDHAVYIRYSDDVPQVLYNDTEREITPEMIQILEKSMWENMGGFVISKISSNYSEHRDITSIFGEDEVCSMVAIPFFDNEKIENIFITYVLMKDNWHTSVNRYMLDEDDLNYYQLLFREVRYALKRLDAYDKIYEMNTKLYLSAVTDQLTGVYNREGFYRKQEEILSEIKCTKREPKLGLMFIDLDNFKHYNDTYGHDVGDFVLIRMAEIFKQVCGEDGFVCRFGGDEFLLFLYTDDAAVFEAKAKAIYRMLADSNGFEDEIGKKRGTKITIDEKQRISCSMGIAAGSRICTADDMRKLMKHADDLLYSVKTSTKGTYHI